MFLKGVEVTQFQTKKASNCKHGWSGIEIALYTLEILMLCTRLKTIARVFVYLGYRDYNCLY